MPYEFSGLGWILAWTVAGWAFAIGALVGGVLVAWAILKTVDRFMR